MTMTNEQARLVKRNPVRIGERCEFYSTVQQEYLPIKERLRNYTGQTVTVTASAFGPDNEGDWVEGESERMFKVRADDSFEFEAYEGELNGWFKDTGQFFWSDATYGPDHDRTFLSNERWGND